MTLMSWMRKRSTRWYAIVEWEYWKSYRFWAIRLSGKRKSTKSFGVMACSKIICSGPLFEECGYDYMLIWPLRLSCLDLHTSNKE